MRRIITRPQSLLRAFFGLGPEQFEFEDIIVPTYDVERLMRNNSDCQVIVVSSGAIAPAAAASVTVNMPTAGSWLVHAVGLTTTGPATSGSVRMNADVFLRQGSWAGAQDTRFGLFSTNDSMPREAGEQMHRGVWFDTPITLRRTVGGTADAIVAQLFNEAASVGNAVLECHVLVRPAEPVVTG